MKKLLTVTAPGNEAVKSIAKLSSSKKARDEARAFVAEGRKLVEEALAGGCELLELFVLKDALGAYEALFPSVSGTVYAVTQPIMNKITESKTPQDITAVFAYKSSGLPKDGRRYLCLERVQEPGNVGALIRSASAFGFDGVVLSADCADVYSVKALRGAMGATFRLPVVSVADLRGFVREMRGAGFKAYAAALNADAVSLGSVGFADKLLLLIGNEGNGLDGETVAACDEAVRIPMAQGTESLNAAVAGAVHQAVREALANCLVNADYYGRGGLVIIKRRGEITMSNPGNFRIELAAAKAGGLSDPRNGTMLKMFNMIDIGERAGSGIPNIFRVWHDQGWAEPTITQSMNPDRITLSLVLSPTSTDKSAIKIGDKSNSAIKSAKRQMIIEYLTDHPAAKSAEIAEYVDLKPSRVRDYLAELIAEEIVVAEGGNRNRTYRLKA